MEAAANAARAERHARKNSCTGRTRSRRTAVELTAFVAVMPRSLPCWLETGEIKGGPMPARRRPSKRPSPRSPPCSQGREAWSRNGRQDLGRQDRSHLRPRTGGFPVRPGGMLAWSTLFDLIHHRGQLSTYLRPMGGRCRPSTGPLPTTRARCKRFRAPRPPRPVDGAGPLYPLPSPG